MKRRFDTITIDDSSDAIVINDTDDDDDLYQVQQTMTTGVEKLTISQRYSRSPNDRYVKSPSDTQLPITAPRNLNNITRGPIIDTSCATTPRPAAIPRRSATESSPSQMIFVNQLVRDDLTSKSSQPLVSFKPSVRPTSHRTPSVGSTCTTSSTSSSEIMSSDQENEENIISNPGTANRASSFRGNQNVRENFTKEIPNAQASGSSDAPIVIDDTSEFANDVFQLVDNMHRAIGDGEQSSSDERELNSGDYLDDDAYKMFLEEQAAKAATTFLHAFLPDKSVCLVGSDVEFNDGKFMRVEEIVTQRQDKISLHGKLMVRQNKLRPMFPNRKHELIWLEDTVSIKRGYSKKDLASVIRLRQIIFTNVQNLSHDAQSGDQWFDVGSPSSDNGRPVLYCRWRMIDLNENDKLKREITIDHLRLENADDIVAQPATRITNTQARYLTRKTLPSQLGGSHHQEIVYLDANGTEHTEQRQMYTFGDAFCGAGGTSRGAHDAGLKIKWAFDYDINAINSYRANFRRFGTLCMHTDAHSFILGSDCARCRVGVSHLGNDEYQIDVLHLSPPCQPFSPAHTVPSQVQDEMNQASLFAVADILRKVKPRVVTLEETEGLLNRHTPWFYGLIHGFIHNGYSVRWKVLMCKEYGVPQSRRRLCLIAAGPGEKLPPFPPPTHSDTNPQLKPFETINSVINGIPRNAPNHNLDAASFRDHRFRVSFDGDRLANTLTCSGGQGNYHPSGRRNYTILELSALQTFPLNHKFSGATGISMARKQIGNAVPPLMAKCIYKTIVQSLKESDAEELREMRQRQLQLTGARL